MPIGRKTIDLTGNRFGRLVVSHRALSRGRGKGVYWVANCDCGGTTTACASDFKKGAVNSCGCLRREIAASKGTHRESHPRTKEYAIWCGMRQRCQDINCKDYKKYGGRGIAISQEFLKYETFLEVMGRCPVGMSLERKDNDGPYSAENCVWGSQVEQSNNKRNNKTLTFQKETKTLAEWARDPRCLVSYALLKSRVGRQGWSLQYALSTPSQPKNWMKGKKQDHFKGRSIA